MALIEVPPAWEPWLQAQRSAYPWQAGVLRDDPFGLWVLSRRPGVLTVETAAGGIPWVQLDLAGGWSVAARRVLPARGLSSDHRAVWNALCADAR